MKKIEHSLKLYRNRILTEFHSIIKNEELTKRLSSWAGEHAKWQHQIVWSGIKKIKHSRPPQKLLIKGKKGLTAIQAEQSKIIAEYFKRTFYKNKQPTTIIPPTWMTIPFTANEIRKAIAKMKPNKSPSCDLWQDSGRAYKICTK